MKWTKRRGLKCWDSNTGYTIDAEPPPYATLTSHSITGPRATDPPHWRPTVGGCNSLPQAKQMAERHARGDVGR
jgi:hypothetical protein